jgi:hypothetical protein
MWLANRSDRSQEGAALRPKRRPGTRQPVARPHDAPQDDGGNFALARSAAVWHFVTTRQDLDVMKKLHQEGVAGEMGEIASPLC